MNIAIMNQRIVRGLAKSVSSPNSIRFLSTKKAGGVSGGAKKKVQNDSSKSENAALLKFYEKVQQVNR